MSAGTPLDIFVPPEGIVGQCAALVAMTGTEDFLEDAVQCFTGERMPEGDREKLLRPAPRFDPTSKREP